MGYDFELSLDANDSAGIILNNIKPNSRVLEFGCAHGRMTAYMQKKLSCEVFIVEYDKDAFRDAAAYAADGICGDIADYSWAERFRGTAFDYIIFADVLEHLYAPEEALRRTKELLKDSGCVLLSLPNLGHSDVAANLFYGQFEYTQYGLLDHTHIRFFTGGMLDGFCAAAGYRIVEQMCTSLPAGQTEQAAVRKHAPGILMDNLLAAREYGSVYQFILKLQKAEYVQGRHIRKKINYCNVRKPCVAVSFRKEADAPADVQKKYEVSRIDGEKYTAEFSEALEEGVSAVCIAPVEGQPCIMENLRVFIEGGKAEVSCSGMRFGGDRFFLNSTKPQAAVRILDRGNGRIKVRFDFYLQGQAYLDKLHEISSYLQQENEALQAEKAGLISAMEDRQAEYRRRTGQLENAVKQALERNEALQAEKAGLISAMEDRQAEHQYRTGQMESIIKLSQARLARSDYALCRRPAKMLRKAGKQYYHKMLSMLNRYRRKQYGRGL